MFFEAHPTFHYVIGVDQASGKAGANESVANVLCLENGKQVAICAGMIHPEDMAREVEKAGYYFNTAEIAVEMEFHGSTTITALREVHYPNLFFHVETLDKFSKNPAFFGWDHRRAREIAINWLQQDIGYSVSTREDERKRALYVYDPDSINQLGWFVRNKETGKYQAAPGKYDDRVSALYISNYVRRLRNKPYLETVVEKKPEETPFLDLSAKQNDDGEVNLLDE